MPAKSGNFNKKTSSKNFSTNVLLSEGNKYLRLLQFEKAISCYEKILQQNANHVQSLLGKAKCYMRQGRYKEALVVFDKLLSINPKCAEAINLKGIAEYSMGNFEKSFITYWQGHQIKPFCDYLRLGYRFCKETIENSLNAEERMLLTEKDIVNLNNLFLKADVDDDSSTSYDTKGLYSDHLKLLDDMCKDKSLETLHSSCAELFSYLRGRQKFWKMQKPLKTIDKPNSWIFIRNNMHDSVQMSKLIRNFGLCGLALNERKTAFCINKGKEVLSSLNKIRENFPGKNEIEVETLHYILMAYLIKGDFETALEYCTQLYSTICEKDMPKLKGKALRNFGEVYYKLNKYKDSLNYFLESLLFAKSEEERAAVLYKISDCNIHLNNLKDAKDTAIQCLNLVVKNQNLRFQFDALLLLAEIAVKGKEMKLAEEHYKKALEIAVQNKDARKADLVLLLKIFEEVAAKDSYSKERIKIINITNNLKQS